jgi:hypothetical protein
VVKIAGTGILTFEKVCDSVQKSCNGSGSGFLRREMLLLVKERRCYVVETAFKIVYREDGR